MNLHEYQSKALFKQYKLPTAANLVIYKAEDATDACKQLGGERWVVKAQIHAGGRGKAGAVKVVDSHAKAEEFAREFLSKKLVTFQTSSEGQPVSAILIEELTNVDKELYFGATIDRSTQKIVFITSCEGGVDIEEVADKHPEKIIKTSIDPLVGAMPYQAREIAFKLNLNAVQIKEFTNIFLNAAKMFQEKDLALLEINPLAITKDGSLKCLDAKVSIDNNALFKQKDLKQLADLTQDNEKEVLAASFDLNYIALNGNIGCMVNGAGLAMATMDIIDLYGGKPANFLDVGGSATKERVSQAFKIIIADEQVKAIFVNIFGGIVRCDLIANGIIEAINEVDLKIPVVVRLEGNNANIGLELINNSGLNIEAAASLTDAAQKVTQKLKV